MTAVPQFPTYTQWLWAHSDADITALLWRLHPQGSTAFADLSTPEPALTHLSAVELAILHAAVEIGAAEFPTSVDDLTETLTELCDIAGTPAPQRPTPPVIQAALCHLASWGLVFSPDLQIDSTPPLARNTLIAIPAHLPPLFEPTTEQPWRLADHHRCPIPTAEIPPLLAGLPPRQRKLLDTLSTAAGVGHSTSVRPGSDPTAPLPTLVALGVLDQLDDTTVRLSGRIAAALRGTIIASPGGDFSTAFPLSSHPAPVISQPATEAGVAAAVQTMQEFSEALMDLGAHPVVPLSAGGVGTREINRIARRRGIHPHQAEKILTDLRISGFLGRDFPEPAPHNDTGRTYWALTSHALDFLQAPTAKRWALALMGWVSSPYSPWLHKVNDAQLLSPDLDNEYATQLRHYFPHISLACAADATARPAELLWRECPALAWRCPDSAWVALAQEATALGLISTDQQPTSAAVALTELCTHMQHRWGSGNPLAWEECVDLLTSQLQPILPAPVSTLIIQGDHTILAPGMLTTQDHHFLSLLADLESAGIASVWRISTESLGRALTHGLTVDSVEEFFDTRVPGGLAAVPQSVRYLLRDATHAPEATPAALHHLPACTDTIEATAREIAAAVESFRHHHTHHSYRETRKAQTPREIMACLRQAYSDGTPVRIHYVDHAGARTYAWMSIVLLSPSALSAVDDTTGESVRIPPHRISAVEVPVL